MSKKKNVQNKKYRSIQIGLISVLGIVLIVLSAIIVKDKIEERKTQNEIMDSFYEYYEKEELTLIYYTSSSCEFCEMQTPILENIAADYDLDYLAVDYTKLTNKQRKEVLNKLDIEHATPTTVVMKNGKVIAVQKGYVDGNKYVEFLVKAGILDDGSVYGPEKNLTFIDYDKFEKLILEKEPVIITIGSATCTFCAKAKPILSNIAKAYNIPIYYLTLDYFSKDERLAVVEALKDMKYNEEYFVKEQKLSTPAVLIIEDGKIIDYTTGLQNISIYTKLFKDTNVIK